MTRKDFALNIDIKGNGKFRRKAKKPQETKDISEEETKLTNKKIANRGAKASKKDKDMSLNNLIQAAKFVESDSPSKFSGKKRKNVKVHNETKKKKLSARKSRTGKKLLEVISDDSDEDIFSNSSDEEDDTSDDDDKEDIKELLKQCDVKKLSKLLKKMKKQKRKKKFSKNGKGKEIPNGKSICRNDSDDDVIDDSMLKAGKKMKSVEGIDNSENIKEQCGNNVSSTGGMVHDNFAMMQYQMWMQSQMMYGLMPPFMPTPMPMQPYAGNYTAGVVPNADTNGTPVTTVATPAVSQVTSVAPSSANSALVLSRSLDCTSVPPEKSSTTTTPSTSTITAPYLTAEYKSTEELPLENMDISKMEIDVEGLSSNANSPDKVGVKKIHYGKENTDSDDSDSGASVVYDLPESVKSMPVNKNSTLEPIKDSLIDNLLGVNTEKATPSFLGFCDNINNPGETVQSTVISSTESAKLKSEESTKKPTTSDELSDEVTHKEEKVYKNLTKAVAPVLKKKPVETSVADILMNLIPEQQRFNNAGYSSNKLSASKEEERRIGQALMRIAKSPLTKEEDERKIGHALIQFAMRHQHNISTPLRRQKYEDKEKQNNYAHRQNYVGNSTWINNSTQNLYLQDQDGDTILHILIAKEEEEQAIDVVKRMKGYRLDILNALGQTPLHLAMYVKRLKIIETLLQHGAGVSIVDAHGNSPLHIACEENSLEMIKVLFEYQAIHRDKYEEMMQTRNNQGLAAVHIATQKKNMDILKFLVTRGIDLDIQEGRSGATPLVMALSNREWTLAEFFIKHNAGVNIPNFSNIYPLHLAVQGNNMEMVKLLMSRGSEIGNKANDYDVTAAGESLEIKQYLTKEMRKRRRQRAKAATT